MRKGGGKPKGNSFEGKVCKLLSLWATRGQDDTQLIPARLSGGWRGRSRRNAGTFTSNNDWRQLGDIAPNGEHGDELRTHIAVEAKHRKKIDVWHHWTADPSDSNLHGWWRKLHSEIESLRGSTVVTPLPLIVFRPNNRPIMAATYPWVVETILAPMGVLQYSARDLPDMAILELQMLLDKYRPDDLYRIIRIKRSPVPDTLTEAVAAGAR